MTTPENPASVRRFRSLPQLRRATHVPRAHRRDIVHPLVIEWVRPGSLETNPRTGKPVRLLDRRTST